jgi:tetratricopeptide (TPR) repeat protein
MNTPNTHDRGLFIGLRRDQLGARLLMMLNAIRLSQDFNTDYRINWFPRGAMAPTLDRPIELFSAEYITQHFIENEAFDVMEGNSKSLWEFLDDKTPDRLNAHLAAGKHIILDEGFEVVSFAWEDEGALRSRYKNFIQDIDFQDSIISKMQIIDTALHQEKSHVTAYHIRRGDLLNGIPWKDNIWPSKFEADELYSTHIKANPDSMPLVFSDQVETIEAMRTALPQVRGISDLIDLSDCLVCQRDFLELYTMSQADQIIAPIISAFSMAAARMSGQQRLRFVDVLSRDQMNEAYEQVLQRFTDGLDNFVNLSEAAHMYSRLSKILILNDRELESYFVGSALLEAKAENAFLPMLHAFCCCYLSKWDEALSAVDKALASPGLWNEHYAISLGLKSHIEGALGKAAQSRQHWMQSFWLKPLLADTLIFGAHMIYNRRLRPEKDIPYDAKLLIELKVGYQNRKSVGVHGKIIRRKALNLSALIIEWPYFVLDRKSMRVVTDKAALNQLYTQITQEIIDPGLTDSINSFAGLIQSYLGNHKQAVELSSTAIDQMPMNTLFQKRHSEILFAAGHQKQALKIQRKICEAYPENPWYLYLHAHCLESSGDKKAAEKYFKKAAQYDTSTARIHAKLADIYKAKKNYKNAVSALTTAVELAPSFKQFSNQVARYLKKI